MGSRGSISGSSHKSSKVFGVELADQLKSEGGQVPSVIIACVAAVEKRGLEVEGIYRVSGAATQTNKLRDAFSQGKYVILSGSFFHFFLKK